MQTLTLLSALLSASSMASAYRVLQPSNMTRADKGSILTVQWEMTDMDPETFDITLSHMLSGTPFQTSLATNVNGYAGSYNVILPTDIPGGFDYQININRRNLPFVIYAQSSPFTITNSTSKNTTNSITPGPAPTSISPIPTTGYPTVTVIEPVIITKPAPDTVTVFSTSTVLIDCGPTPDNGGKGGDNGGKGGDNGGKGGDNGGKGGDNGGKGGDNGGKGGDNGGKGGDKGGKGGDKGNNGNKNGSSGGLPPANEGNKVAFTFTLISLITVSATYALLM